MQQHNQKQFVHLIAKSKKVTLTELAEVLDLKLSSFRVTLGRGNLMLHQFLTIYNHLYKEDYQTDTEFLVFLDVMRQIPDFSLKQFVEAMNIFKKQAVTATLYGDTKIQLIN